MTNTENYTKIVTCPLCGGNGYTKKYNDRDRDYDRETCTRCDGRRVVKKVVSVKYVKIDKNE